MHEYFGYEDVVRVPDGIKVIGNKAFAGHKMKKVYLPDSVTHVEDLAFPYCDKLEYIVGNGVVIRIDNQYRIPKESFDAWMKHINKPIQN